MQSLGTRELPNLKRVKDSNHTEGLYFLMDVDLKTSELVRVKDEYNRDKDIVQISIFAKSKREEAVFTCPEELDLELLPPAERPSVADLVREGRRPPRFRKIFDDRTGLDYYPFHR